MIKNQIMMIIIKLLNLRKENIENILILTTDIKNILHLVKNPYLITKNQFAISVNKKGML